MSDNRQRPRIHRCDDKHDALIRAYAEQHGIEPWQALETAIQRLKDPDAIDRLTEECDALRAELASAREATRRAEERIAELETALADWREASGEQPAAKGRRRAPESTPLPADFETKVRARAKAHGQTIERTRARVIELGFSRYDALAKAKGGRAP